MKKIIVLIGIDMIFGVNGCLPQRQMRQHDEIARCEVWKADPAEIDSTAFDGHDWEEHSLDCETYEMGWRKCPILLRKVEAEQHRSHE